MTTYLLLALPLAAFWMGVSNLVTLESFLVGYALALGGLLLFRPQRWTVRWRKLPGQLAALMFYAILLYWDILLSGIDLARRVLSRDMRLKPGIIAVPIQDPDNSPLIAALSADVVTLTPGELVVEIEGRAVMYVHCLDVEAVEDRAASIQAKRLRLMQRILGR